MGKNVAKKKNKNFTFIGAFPGAHFEIECKEINGVWALHRSVRLQRDYMTNKPVGVLETGEGWQVSHVPTGRVVIQPDTYLRARALWNALQEEDHSWWSEGTLNDGGPGFPTPPKLILEVRKRQK